MDAGLEIPIAGENGSRDQIVLGDRLLHRRMERAGIADASRAAIAHNLKAEPVEVGLKAALGQVVPTTREPGASEDLTVAGTASPRSTAFFASNPGRQHDAGIGLVGATGDGRDEDAAVSNIPFDSGAAP